MRRNKECVDRCKFGKQFYQVPTNAEHTNSNKEQNYTKSVRMNQKSRRQWKKNLNS